jgi:SAM-dependent methyltransferase
VTKVGTLNESNRAAWLERVLKDIPPGLRILDAGAGEQQYRQFCSHLVYVSQDFARYDGKGNNTGLQMGAWDQSKLDVISDISSIPLEDASFDAIMCVEVLEHLPNPLLAIKEFNRLLKEGGRLIITAPFGSLTHFAPYHFSTGFNTYYYEQHLKENGFDITEITANGNYFEALAQEMRRIPFAADKYSHERISIVERLCIKYLLKMLERLSDNDTGSSTLLCHGYHVLARKTTAAVQRL